LPILDWFHIALRLQHLKQIASALTVDDPERLAAKAVIVAEVERLHWRIWNGKAKNAQISIDRIRAIMHHFQDEPGTRRSIAPVFTNRTIQATHPLQLTDRPEIYPAGDHTPNLEPVPAILVQL
jgi:hypothetical protein